MPKVADASSLLDPEILEVLSSMDAFFIQQRVRLVEAGTCGCCEQPNVYDVFHHETKQRIMVSYKSWIGVCRLKTSFGFAFSHVPLNCCLLNRCNLVNLFVDHEGGIGHVLSPLLQTRPFRLCEILPGREGRSRAQTRTECRLVL